MARYGVPYRGSKSRIAPWVVEHLPSAGTFVDLFAGGCAVTHAALLAGRWERYIVNDLGDAPRLFIDAANNKSRRVTERLFVHGSQLEAYERMIGAVYAEPA